MRAEHPCQLPHGRPTVLVPLRHVRQDVPKTIASTLQAPLRIAFPLDGSRVDLGFSHEGEEKGSLVLKASGGAPPLTWIADGAPVEVAKRRPCRMSSTTPS